jgi:hypothetical protein
MIPGVGPFGDVRIELRVLDHVIIKSGVVFVLTKSWKGISVTLCPSIETSVIFPRNSYLLQQVYQCREVIGCDVRFI